MLWKNRREIIAALKKLPMKYRIGIAVLLIVCAFIPGPIDDIIVGAIVLKLAR